MPKSKRTSVKKIDNFGIHTFEDWKDNWEDGELYMYTGNGCEKHDNCFTCIFGDECKANPKTLLYKNIIVKQKEVMVNNEK